MNSPNNPPISLQLYTLREQTKQDFVGTLKEVAAIGYRGVELAGTGNLTAPELKKVLDDLGLKVVGSHIGIERFENSIQDVFEENRALGNQLLVVPWLAENRRNSAEAWRTFAHQMNEIGQRCREAGFTLCYHNHAFEFQTFEGKTGFDIFYETADPALVQVELDVYWVKDGGYDPAAIIERFTGRLPLVHLKDMTAGDPHTFAEVGEGVIDFAAILRACVKAGVRAYIVEQDQCQRPPLDAVRISYNNLTHLLGTLQTA